MTPYQIKLKFKDLWYRLKVWLNRAGWIRNAKQRGWQTALAELKRDQLVVLETGRIRNAQWVLTDGNSTHFFSRMTRVRQLISVDNDSENFSGLSSSEAYCRQYLSARQLAKIKFINGDSRQVLPCLPANTVIDVALLDSANDPALIYDELLAVLPFLTRRPALIIIDDVTAPGKKGDLAVPYLERLNYPKHLVEAAPSDCAYFILP